MNKGYNPDNFIEYLRNKNLFNKVVVDWTRIGDYEYYIDHVMHGKYNVLVRIPEIESTHPEVLFVIDD